MDKTVKGVLIFWLVAVGAAFTIVPYKQLNINLLGLEVSSGRSYGFVFSQNLQLANISFPIIFAEVVLISIVALILYLVINRR